MKSSSDADVRQALAPLIAVLREARAWRLTARPGRVIVDHNDGPRQLETAWSGEDHDKAWNALGAGASWFVDGLSAVAVGDAVLIVRGPDANRRIEDLARDGTLSSLAARLLDASVAIGRNIVVAGPWLASVELISSITAGGVRPAILGGVPLPLPGTWLRADDASMLGPYGADRVGTWASDIEGLTRLMATTSGIIGWVDARRLDRVLIRYEAAIDTRAQAPLHVVAGVDVVVVLQGGRVREIAEIGMAPDGYRPHLLFSTGMPPSPTALVPLAAPSFVDELASAGFGVLADELRALAPPAPVRHAEDPYANAVERARAVAAQIDDSDFDNIANDSPRRGRSGGRTHDPLGIREALRPQGRGEPRVPDLTTPEIPSAVVEALRHAPPPGWELDRMGEDALADEQHGSHSTEDAAMAATFGLAPPPRPAGFKGEAVSFADLLKRTKEREGGSDDDLPLPPPNSEEP